MKFFLLLDVKMSIIVRILTFMSSENSTLGLSEPKKKNEFLNISLYVRVFEIICLAELTVTLFGNIST